MSRAVKRIALASGLAVALIAAAVFVTLWSYHDAVHARELAQSADHQNTIAQLAETYLSREHEAMNEYVLDPRIRILDEVRTLRSSFREVTAHLEEDEIDQHRVVLAARGANEAFVAGFFARSHSALRSAEARSRLVLMFDEREEAVLAPFRTLRLLNAHEARANEAEADSQGRRAFVAGLVAGLLSILGGGVFAVYAISLVGRVARQNAELHELDRMKDDFVASVSHELRTPLTSIRGYLELVLEEEVGDVNPQQHEFLSIVVRNSDRLLSLVNDLLFVAQVDAGLLELELEDVDLGNLVQTCIESARPRAEQGGIELAGSSGHPLPLSADAKRLSQLLDNLVSNAIKFTPRGGTVTVSATPDDGRAVLQVTDTGMGIAAAEQEHLFERFYRTAGAASVAGTGLGLAIVKAIVDAHKGEIDVRSELGRGTTFRVELPLSTPEILEAAA